MTSTANNLDAVQRYYRRAESRAGYRLVLGGTKHFGWYEPGDSPWRLAAAMRRMEDQLARRLDLRPGARVLDAGCGTGAVATRLASVHGLHVTGIDILDFNITAAGRRAGRAHVASRTHFQLGDYAHLDFPTEAFDGAYTMETLVHSDAVDQVLAELYRVLRPGGRLVQFEYSRAPRSVLGTQAERVLTEVNTAAAMPGFQRLEHGLLEQLLVRAGFADVHAEDVTARMLPMLRVFAILGWPTYQVARLLGQRTSAVNAEAGVEFYRHQEAWQYQIYTCRKPA